MPGAVVVSEKGAPAVRFAPFTMAEVALSSTSRSIGHRKVDLSDILRRQAELGRRDPVALTNRSFFKTNIPHRRNALESPLVRMEWHEASA